MFAFGNPLNLSIFYNCINFLLKNVNVLLLKKYLHSFFLRGQIFRINPAHCSLVGVNSVPANSHFPSVPLLSVEEKTIREGEGRRQFSGENIRGRESGDGENFSGRNSSNDENFRLKQKNLPVFEEDM